MNPSDIIPLPDMKLFNKGLTPVTAGQMIKWLGVPGPLTPNCSPPTGAFAAHVVRHVSASVLIVTGYGAAVKLLQDALNDAATQVRDAFNGLETAGMLCVRSRRGNTKLYSNHSWGCAIDLYYGKDVVPQGVRKCHRGLVALAPFMNKHGWYWGAGFSGKSVDSMHFELAAETMARIHG